MTLILLIAVIFNIVVLIRIEKIAGEIGDFNAKRLAAQQQQLPNAQPQQANVKKKKKKHQLHQAVAVTI